jgi:hypothetical protein
MPATSQKQQEFMAIQYEKAKAGKPHETTMTIQQLRDFAATKRKRLPARAAGVRRAASVSAQKIASAKYSRRAGTAAPARHAAAVRSGNFPKGAR